MSENHPEPRIERKTSNHGLSRRFFMSSVTGLGAGLVLSVNTALCSQGQTPPSRGREEHEPPFSPAVYVHIAPDGKITLYSKGPEMGQGIKTSFGLLLAEELDANWADVIVEQAPVDAAVYGQQSAGGSRSTPTNWMPLRQAGAGARAMLIAAAAKQWGVAEADIATENSFVRHASSNRTASYGSLALAAAAMPVPDPRTLKLKKKGAFRLLGQRYSGVDNRQIVTGGQLFGIDVQFSDLKIAVFQKCPVIYGKVADANLDEIKSLRGVTDAFVVEGTGKPSEVLNGVAIIATNTWAALSAKRRLNVTWDLTQASTDSWTEHVAEAARLSNDRASAQVVKSIGDVDAVFSGRKRIEARYSYGFVAHGQLEPMNCTAWYKKAASGDSLEIWAPTQNPAAGQAIAARLTGLAPDRITMHQQRIGGAFGRRLNNDYVAEAAVLSRQAGGIPIKLMWTREDDMEHDFIRPAGFMTFVGAVDDGGSIAAWESHIVHFKSEGGTAILAANWQPNEFPALHLAHYRASQTFIPLKMPTGSWRAPGAATAAWLVQSFLHELSVAAKRDHADFLVELVNRKAPQDPNTAPSHGAELSAERATNVIKAAVVRSGWGKRQLPAGRALGLAFHYSNQAYICQVADVSVGQTKKVTVHHVWVVSDVGPIINLSGAEAQCQGSVIDGIATLGLEVTIEEGEIQQKNFDRYPLERIQITPVINVHFLDTNYPPTGLGEPVLPPIGPAVCNAIFNATGHRIRTLPIIREGFSI